LLSGERPESKKLQPFGQYYAALHQSGVVSSDSRTNYLLAHPVNIHLHYVLDLFRRWLSKVLESTDRLGFHSAAPQRRMKETNPLRSSRLCVEKS
jgi:hypothetical protein